MARALIPAVALLCTVSILMAQDPPRLEAGQGREGGKAQQILQVIEGPIEDLYVEDIRECPGSNPCWANTVPEWPELPWTETRVVEVATGDGIEEEIEETVEYYVNFSGALVEMAPADKLQALESKVAKLLKRIEKLERTIKEFHSRSK